MRSRRSSASKIRWGISRWGVVSQTSKARGDIPSALAMVSKLASPSTGDWDAPSSTAWHSAQSFAASARPRTASPASDARAWLVKNARIKIVVNERTKLPPSELTRTRDGTCHLRTLCEILPLSEDKTPPGLLRFQSGAHLSLRSGSFVARRLASRMRVHLAAMLVALLAAYTRAMSLPKAQP